MTLAVTNLQCVRGDRELFSGLSFSLKPKQLMRIEGKNGTGKTTLLRTLCGLREPQQGEVLWNQKAIKKHAEQYRQALFYLGHSNAIKADLNALENLHIATTLANKPHSETERLDALEQIGLFGFEYLPTRQLSQGQKRRVALATLLLNKAPLWILDEPFVALDAAAVTQLQAIIATHVENGGMVILTTHQEVPLNTGEVIRHNLDRYAQSSDTQNAANSESTNA